MTSLLLVGLLQLVSGLPAPPSGKCVLDEVGALSQADFNSLETECEAVNQSGSGQIMTAVVASLRGYSNDEFSVRLFKAWGVGHSGRNDGVLVVLSPTERKWRIVVGSGLESIITNARAADIGRNRGVPSFKLGLWGTGLINIQNSIAPMLQAVPAPRVAPKTTTTTTTTTETTRRVIGRQSPTYVVDNTPVSGWFWIFLITTVVGILAYLIYRARQRHAEEMEVLRQAEESEKRRSREAAERATQRQREESFSTPTPPPKRTTGRTYQSPDPPPRASSSAPAAAQVIVQQQVVQQSSPVMAVPIVQPVPIIVPVRRPIYDDPIYVPPVVVEEERVTRTVTRTEESTGGSGGSWDSDSGGAGGSFESGSSFDSGGGGDTSGGGAGGDF